MRSVLLLSLICWVLAAPLSADEVFQAAGRIESTTDNGGCSAVLIRPDVILTAAHCVREDEDSSYAFRPTGSTERIPVRRVMMHPLYIAFFAHRLRRLRFDFAIGQLDRSIDSNTIRPVNLSTTAASAGEGLFIVSWRNPRSTRPKRRRCLVVDGSYAGVVTLGCQVRGGESGAPVFRLTGDGSELVAVVNSTARQDGRSVALASNVVDRISVLFDRLAATP